MAQPEHPPLRAVVEWRRNRPVSSPSAASLLQDVLVNQGSLYHTFRLIVWRDIGMSATVGLVNKNPAPFESEFDTAVQNLAYQRPCAIQNVHARYSI